MLPAIARGFSSGSGLYSGPSGQYVDSETDGAHEGVEIELTLPGARLLLDRPQEALSAPIGKPTKWPVIRRSVSVQ